MKNCFAAKRSLFIFLMVLFSITALSGCKKIVDKVFPGFDASLTDIPATIPPIPVSYYTLAIARTSAFNLDSIVKAESGGTFGGKDLTSVKVKQAILYLQNADSVTTLAELSSITIQLFSDTNNTPVTIATANVPDTATSTQQLDTSNSPELLPYLQGHKITYIVTAVSRRPTINTLAAFVDLTLAIK